MTLVNLRQWRTGENPTFCEFLVSRYRVNVLKQFSTFRIFYTVLLVMNNKRTYKSRGAKKAEKRKRELLAIKSSPFKKKLCFTKLDRIEVTDNNTKSKFFSCINALCPYYKI